MRPKEEKTTWESLLEELEDVRMDVISAMEMDISNKLKALVLTELAENEKVIKAKMHECINAL